MKKVDYDVDWQLCLEFFDESLDSLAIVSNRLCRLAEEEDNREHIDAVFRTFHSIKGNSAFFNLMNVKSLAHELENLLDQIRKNKISVDRGLVELLVNGTDTLTDMFQRVRNEEPEVADKEYFQTVVGNITKVLSSEKDTGIIWQAVFQNLGTMATWEQKLTPDMNEGVRQLSRELTKLYMIYEPGAAKQQPGVGKHSALQQLLKHFANRDDLVMGQEQVEETIALFKQLEQTEMSDENRELLQEITEEFHICRHTVGIDALIRELIYDKLFKLDIAEPEPAEEVGNEPETELIEAVEPAVVAEMKKTEGLAGEKTMRVSEKCIDDFLEYVGELVIVQEFYEHLNMRMNSNGDISKLSAELKRANQSLSDLVHNLEKNIMDVRKISLGSLLQRVPKMVRDVAQKSGKQVNCQISGERLRIDKSLVDALEAPLTHLVRNAADHGIEEVATRLELGKKEVGTISIDASQSGDFLIVTIQDDGGGLNYDALKKKGLESGLLSPGELVDKERLHDLLFMPGVSTASSVTDISGRGVGMDVVRKNIEEMNGSIEIESIEGQGTTFTVKMPTSIKTQIITGLLVKLTEQPYVIPMDVVHNCIEPSKEQFVVSPKVGVCFDVNGELLKAISLYHLFGYSQTVSSNDMCKGRMVTIGHERPKAAVHVDEVIGLSNLVVKKIKGLKGDANDIFTGGALLGSGDVAMVLDIDKLLEVGDLQGRDVEMKIDSAG